MAISRSSNLTVTSRPIINRIPTAKAPSVKLLKSVLGANQFHGLLKWSSKKPAGQVANEVVVVKPKPAPSTSITVTAFQLARNPNLVYFMRAGSVRPQFSPVFDITRIPKGLPPTAP